MNKYCPPLTHTSSCKPQLSVCWGWSPQRTSSLYPGPLDDPVWRQHSEERSWYPLERLAGAGGVLLQPRLSPGPGIQGSNIRKPAERNFLGLEMGQTLRGPTLASPHKDMAKVISRVTGYDWARFWCRVAPCGLTLLPWASPRVLSYMRKRRKGKSVVNRSGLLWPLSRGPEARLPRS